jgi:hemoglobin/transferrin/lactoferrin receptor protein
MRWSFRIVFLLPVFMGSIFTTPAQEKKDSAFVQLDEVVVSFNKWEQSRNEIPNRIEKINRQDVKLRNPQTTADLLGQMGGVFIQKSQLSGGSPMIRGFATNRVLIVNDGVRMNNAIYRSGNLQNIISIDPFTIENGEVIFGPGSLIYGSDAIGGVMDFRSVTPKFSDNGKLHMGGTTALRYSSANKEKTIHTALQLGRKKWAYFGSFTSSEFSDLMMGVRGGQDSYLRPNYVQRIGAIDSIIANANPRVQKFSGYSQINVLQKIRYTSGKHWDLQYAFTYAGTGNAPRYDRLIQNRNGKPRFAEWSYGPMLWRMHAFTAIHNRRNRLYDESRWIAAYQNYAESRIDRTRATLLRTIQSEAVGAFSFNWDAQKLVGKTQLFYGLEQVNNKVGSVGLRTNISTSAVTPFVSRYPDNSLWSASGVYLSQKTTVGGRFTLLSGLRYSYNTLSADFDTTFIKFPYKTLDIRDGGLTGNLGAVYRSSEQWQWNANVSTGYRMPNIDDAGKLFESVPGNVTVPNPDLRSEYAWNIEAGFVFRLPNKMRFEVNAFHTLLDNAIVRRPFTFNGADSISFGGINSRVEALQNVSKATVLGLQLSAQWNILPSLVWQGNANWIAGKETDDVRDEQVPLRHAPPFYANALLRYSRNKLFVEASFYGNAPVAYAQLAPSERLKTDIYAKDPAGNPYAPGWHNLNLKVSYQLRKGLSMVTGWENITNQRYRPYSSGLVAAGSNLICSVRAEF